jgi:hypothetical protein
MPDGQPEWELSFYGEHGREPVLDFLRGLEEYKEQALAAALENILRYEGTAVCRSAWGKWVPNAKGIFEFRVRQDAATILRLRGLPVPPELPGERHSDVLLRVFCHAHGRKIVLLLAGYDKGEDASPKRQNAEIKLAAKRLKHWRENEKRRAKQTRQVRGARKTRDKRKT